MSRTQQSVYSGFCCENSYLFQVKGVFIHVEGFMLILEITDVYEKA